MSVVEVVPDGAEWVVRANGFAVVGRSRDRETAIADAREEADRRQAELRVFARSGDGYRTITQFCRSVGYRQRR